MITNSALDFFNKNKSCNWTLDPIPSNLTTDTEIANWLLNYSDFGWIELDIPIDLPQWQQESNNAKMHFVEHRDNQGWNSCCIHGISIDKTGSWNRYGYTEESQVPYNWTSLSVTTPVIKDFWQSKFPSDSYRRIRFMELMPDSAIHPHSDMPGRLPGEDNFDALQFGVPVNIAVIHPAECFMVLEGKGIVPFKQGKMFIINIRHTHSVLNFSNTPRVHVIGHSFGYGTQISQFATLIANSYKKQYEHYRI
jgi:mannose-6-phosphate isomerase-like protein (cupin superfamily)